MGGWITGSAPRCRLQQQSNSDQLLGRYGADANGAATVWDWAMTTPNGGPFEVTGRWVDEGERGAVLILTTLLLVVFMGMAAFAIDLGWLYYNQLNTAKAAEAAALAGVVHMPMPGCVDPGSGDQPTTVARDIAGRQGYQHNIGGVIVAAAKGSNCNRLHRRHQPFIRIALPPGLWHRHRRDQPGRHREVLASAETRQR